MKDIAGIPYCEAQFDKNGTLENESQVSLPAGVTDLFVISHGWNNDAIKLEHSGPEGGPVQVERSNAIDVTVLSEEQRDQLREILEKVARLASPKVVEG